MRPVRQTAVGGPDVPAAARGDCFRACLCSLLELPIDTIANHHGEDWWDYYHGDLRSRGIELVYLGEQKLEDDDDGPSFGDPTWPGYWLAGVPSLNLGNYDGGEPVMHCVVMRGHALVWDPTLGTRYESVRLSAVHDALLLLPHDPAPSVRPVAGWIAPTEEAA